MVVRDRLKAIDQSRTRDRVKTFDVHCESCGWRSTVTGEEALTPPWDNAALELMADEHLLHQQPVCPFDETPVVFISMPNPRRKAKYRVACFCCGRQTDMDWPRREQALASQRACMARRPGREPGLFTNASRGL